MLTVGLETDTQVAACLAAVRDAAPELETWLRVPALRLATSAGGMDGGRLLDCDITGRTCRASKRHPPLCRDGHELRR